MGGANRLLGCLLARSLGAAGLHTATAAAAADAQHTAAADLFAQAVPAGSYRPPVSGSVLKRHGRDLTLDAAEGRLDPLIGRQDVIERALQVGICCSGAVLLRILRGMGRLASGTA